jgi:hypothetical protein
MPHQCEGTTRNGTQCKKTCPEGATRCHIHTGETCPICMLNMSATNTRTLECGHTFHTHCIERWKRRSSTCPNCRMPFDQPMYKVKLTIDPMGYETERTTSNIQSIVDMFGLDNNVERFISTISFAVMNTHDLRNILNDIGFPIIPPGTEFPNLNVN